MAEKFMNKIKKIVLHPSQYYKSIEQDKNYSNTMYFYVKTIILSVIISLIATLISTSILKTITLSSILSTIASCIVNVGMAFLVPFIAAGIIHLGVLIFRGKQGYQSTYKVITSSFVILALYGIISTIILEIMAVVFPIASSLDPSLMIQDPNFLKMIIVMAIIFSISFIHSLVFQVGGISKFQKISKLRAFFAIIIVPLILFIILLAFIVWAITQASILQAAG